MSWFTNAFKSVGKGLAAGAGAIKKIPVVGKPLASVYNLGIAPVSLAADIASGTRLDHALVGHFKAQIRDIKTVGPYAATVVSFVPGVGQGVSGVMGAALAIADGKPLTSIVTAAIKQAVPGGPLAQSAFDAAAAVAQGKSLSESALQALPIDDTQKDALKTAMRVVNDVRQGKKVANIVYEEAVRKLPPDVGKAVSIGMAVGHAAVIQKAASKVKVGGAAVPFVVRAGETSPAPHVALVEGVAASDRLLHAYNGKKTPAEREHAVAVIAATKKAAQGTGPHAVAARNGLTLLRKRAAAHRVAARFEVDHKGFVRVRRAS